MPQDRQAQARGQRLVEYLRPRVDGVQGPLARQRTEQLGDEQRVAARSRHLGQQPRSGRGPQDVGHQVDHGLVG